MSERLMQKFATWATSEDSNQTAHQRGLIWVFQWVFQWMLLVYTVYGDVKSMCIHVFMYDDFVNVYVFECLKKIILHLILYKDSF